MAEPMDPPFTTDGDWKAAVGARSVWVSHEHTTSIIMRIDVASSKPSTSHAGHPFPHSEWKHFVLSGTDELYINRLLKNPALDALSGT